MRFLAMRFAAKEAIVKALGTGFANGMWLRDAGIVPDRRGKPEIIYSARGQEVCADTRRWWRACHACLTRQGWSWRLPY